MSFTNDIVSNMEDMWNVSEEVVKSWYDAAAYQGFDAKAFLLLLLKYKKEFEDEGKNPQEFKVEYDSGGTTSTFSYKSDETFMTDMCFIILIFLQRGSSWDKISGKTNKGIVSILNHLKTKYRINTHKREAGASLASDTVTVPRIAACFPVRILQFIEMGVGRIMIDKSELTNDDIPKWLLHPAAASVLPTKPAFDKTAKLIIVTFGVCVLTDNLLHRKDGKYTPLAQIIAYLEAARQTAAVPEKARAEFLKAVKFYTPIGGDKYREGKDMPSIDAELWQEAILSLRPDDTGAEVVREWIKNQVPAKTPGAAPSTS